MGNGGMEMTRGAYYHILMISYHGTIFIKGMDGNGGMGITRGSHSSFPPFTTNTENSYFARKVSVASSSSSAGGR